MEENGVIEELEENGVIEELEENGVIEELEENGVIEELEENTQPTSTNKKKNSIMFMAEQMKKIRDNEETNKIKKNF